MEMVFPIRAISSSAEPWRLLLGMACAWLWVCDQIGGGLRVRR